MARRRGRWRELFRGGRLGGVEVAAERPEGPALQGAGGERQIMTQVMVALQGQRTGLRREDDGADVGADQSDMDGDGVMMRHGDHHGAIGGFQQRPVHRRTPTRTRIRVEAVADGDLGHPQHGALARALKIEEGEVAQRRAIHALPEEVAVKELTGPERDLR